MKKEKYQEHRDSQKRIYFEDAIYFVTFYAKNRFPFFEERIFCDLFVENLKLCKKIKGFKLYGWVIVYDHIHLLLQPSDDYNISKVIKSLKENVSCAANRIMIPFIPESTEAPFPLLESATTSSRFQEGMYSEWVSCPQDEAHLQRRSRFQEEVSRLQKIYQYKYDLMTFQSEFVKKYPGINPFPVFEWQKSYHDHYIRNDFDFQCHLDYIEYNLIKHDLPENWPYIYTNPEYDDLADEF